MLILEGMMDFQEATVYRDEASDVRFYILPKVPLLRRESGKAVFRYAKYRTLKDLPSGEKGAALVFMDVELALPPDGEATLRGKLVDVVKARRGPADTRPLEPAHIELAKPPVTKGTVAVEILSASKTLVQRVSHAGEPSMYGNNVVAVSAELFQTGAPVFEEFMKGEGPGGVRVVYDLEFAAKLPPVTVTGTWTATKFYEFVQEVNYEERFWSEDDMSENISETFSNSESRKVETDPGTLPTDDPNTASIIETLETAVIRELDEAVKRNLLEALPPENRDVSKIREQDFENIKRSVLVNKRSDVSISYRRGQVRSVRCLPQANMMSLVSQGFKWEDYASLIDTDDPFFRTLILTIQVNADFDNLPIFSVDVTIDYPPETARRGMTTFTFRKADDIGKFTAFIDGGSTRVKYTYVVNYKGESRVFRSAPVEHEGTDLKINVDELGLWLVDIELGDMNFDQVDRAVLTLEHPQVEPGVPPVSRMQIDKNFKPTSVKELLLQPAQPYTATLKYFMKDGREYTRVAPDQKGQRFYVDDPFSATKVVQLRSRGDFERDIDTIFVDLVYEDDRNGYRQTFSMALTKDRRFADWSFPVIDERPSKTTYRALTTFRNGAESDTGEQPLLGSTLIVGDESATLTVRVIPDLIDWELVRLATVELHYVDSEHAIDERESFTFRKGTLESKWELGLRNRAKNTYEWTAKFFMVDLSRKETRSQGPVSDKDLIVEMPT